MPLFSISFRFTQDFPFPAAEAFKWAIDYSPGDIELMGRKGRRSIKRLSDDSFILTDRFENADGAIVTKKKLVAVFREQLAWTSTHLIGATKHSQFHYQIVENGRGRSQLDFWGLQMESDSSQPDLKTLKALTKKHAKEDAATWKKLAKVMTKDLEKAK